jgi:Zn-dependent protease with chaperone function
MDFFEAQDRARRQTKWLLLYFATALLGIVLAMHLLTVVIVKILVERSSAISFYEGEIFLPVAVLTSGLIICASFFKSMQLHAGGSVIAADLGGRLVDPGTTDHHERILLNVTEEMAIASGTPVPQVYILDEELGINSFSAGSEASNAVIGVTRGCVDRLTRAELQGVVAREFSHILNGDMRLNMRLVGLVFGILILMIAGRTILYSLRHLRGSRNSKGGGGFILAVFLLGGGLFLIGGIGVFFARMIQARVSRQRVILADAAAIQFTRQPDGLAGALKKIGGLGLREGSSLQSPRAMEASHMFLAESSNLTLGRSTHPPLGRRIQKMEPHWNGEYVKSALSEIKVTKRAAKVTPTRKAEFTEQMVAVAAMSHLAGSDRWRMDVGQRIRNGIPERFVQASQNRDEAQALIFAMLLADEHKIRSAQVDGLRTGVGSAAATIALEWYEGLGALHSADKIALIDLGIPTLRRMSKPEYERFVDLTRWLVASDQKTELFEFMLQHAIARHLASHFEKRGFPPIRNGRMSDLSTEANVLLSAVARVGREGDAVIAAFQAAAEQWGSSERWTPRLLEADDCAAERLEVALKGFEASAPLLKKEILRLCGLAAAQDGILTSEEAELLRTVADAMGASLPPFVWNLKNQDRA